MKLAKIRKDLLKKGVGVPVGDKFYFSPSPLEYRWRTEVDFEVWYEDKWQEALSIDWDF